MPNCNICNHEDVHVSIQGMGTWHCYEPSLGPPFPYSVCICRGCGHVFGAWDQDRTEQYVSEEYVTSEVSLPIYDAYFTFCLQQLPRYKSRPARVLEIGFNRGALLKHFYDFGCECHGVEPGRKNVEFARKRLPGAHLHAGLFDENFARQFPAGHFDLVILTSVFEHMPRPMDVLKAIRPLLSHAGRLFLLVPDLAQYTPTYQIKPADRQRYGCSPLIFFYRNFFLCYAQHVNHFSPASLARYLGVAGLQPVQTANISGLWYLAAPATPTASHMRFPDILKYHMELMSFYQRLLQRMQDAMLTKLKGKRLVCYGAGRDFGYFMNVFRERGILPLAVADDAGGAGAIEGVKRVSPGELMALRPELCLITTFDHEDVIAPRARALLNEVETITLTQLIYELDIEPPVLAGYTPLPQAGFSKIPSRCATADGCA